MSLACVRLDDSVLVPSVPKTVKFVSEEITYSCRCKKLSLLFDYKDLIKKKTKHKTK